jgi:hypothetical protein
LGSDGTFGETFLDRLEREIERPFQDGRDVTGWDGMVDQCLKKRQLFLQGRCQCIVTSAKGAA